MRQIRKLSLHRSLIRPNLFAGGERKLVMLNYTVIMVLIFGAGLNVLTVITAIILSTFGHLLLSKLAGYDHLFSQVYSRYRRYQDWYSAQSTIRCKHHLVRQSVVKGIRP